MTVATGAGVWGMIIGTGRWSGHAIPEWELAGVLSVLSLSAAAYFGWSRARDPLALLIHADQTLRHPSTLSNAWQLRSDPSPFAALAVQHGEKIAGTIVSPARAEVVPMWPLALRRTVASVGTVALSLAFATAMWLWTPHAPLSTSALSNEQARQLIEDAAQAIAPVPDTVLSTDSKREDPIAARTRSELDAIEKELRQGTIPPDEAALKAARALESAAESLDEQHRNTQTRADGAAAAVSESASKLVNSAQAESPDDLTKALALAELARAAARAEELARQPAQLTESQRHALAEELAAMAEAMNTATNTSPAPDEKQESAPSVSDGASSQSQTPGKNTTSAQQLETKPTSAPTSTSTSADRQVSSDKPKTNSQLEPNPRDSTKETTTPPSSSTRELANALQKAAEQLRNPESASNRQPPQETRDTRGHRDTGKPSDQSRDSEQHNSGEQGESTKSSASNRDQNQSSQTQNAPSRQPDELKSKEDTSPGQTSKQQDQSQRSPGEDNQSGQNPQKTNQQGQSQNQQNGNGDKPVPESRSGENSKSNPTSPKSDSQPTPDSSTRNDPSGKQSTPSSRTGDVATKDTAKNQPNQQQPVSSQRDGAQSKPDGQPNADPQRERDTPDQSESQSSSTRSSPDKASDQSASEPTTPRSGRTEASSPDRRSASKEQSPSQQPDSSTPLGPPTSRPSDRTTDPRTTQQQPTDKPNALSELAQKLRSVDRARQPQNQPSQNLRQKAQELLARTDPQNATPRNDASSSDRSRSELAGAQQDSKGMPPSSPLAAGSKSGNESGDTPGAASMDGRADATSLPRAGRPGASQTVEFNPATSPANTSTTDRVIAELPGTPRSGAASGGAPTVSESVSAAKRQADRAIEGQIVPREYQDLIRRVFRRYENRTPSTQPAQSGNEPTGPISPDAAPAAPRSPSPSSK